MSRHHGKVAPAYSYLLASRCNNFTFGAEFGVPNVSRDLVAHADDIPCVFKNDGVFLGAPTQGQADTIKAVVKEWTSFAKDLKVRLLKTFQDVSALFLKLISSHLQEHGSLVVAL